MPPPGYAPVSIKYMVTSTEQAHGCLVPIAFSRDDGITEPAQMLDSPDHSLFVYNKYLDKESDYQAMSHESFYFVSS